MLGALRLFGAIFGRVVVSIMQPLLEHSTQSRRWFAAKFTTKSAPAESFTKKPASPRAGWLRFVWLFLLVGLPASALAGFDPSAWLIRPMLDLGGWLGLSFAGACLLSCGAAALLALGTFGLIGFAAATACRPFTPGAWTPWRTLLVTAAIAIAVDACLLWGLCGHVPTPIDLLAASAVSALGVGLSLASRRGLGALVNYAICAASICVFALVGTLFVLSDVAPAVSDAPEMSETTRRELRQELKRITRHADGPVRLTLTEDEVNLLAARWIDSLSLKARVDLQVLAGGLSAKASAASPPLWFGTRYLNFDFEFQKGGNQAGNEARGQSLALSAWRLGGFALPTGWWTPIARVISAGQGTRAGDALSAGVVDWRLEDRKIELTVVPSEANSAALSPLEVGLASDDRFTESVRQYREMLSRAAGTAPSGDARFLYLLKALFIAARERSTGGSDAGSAAENRAAIAAFGIAVGDPSLPTMAGLKPHMPAGKTGGKWHKHFANVTLRGRNDWARHFATSAALEVLATESVGRTAGLLKEEWDAGDGGSGFSFADLMADEAGLRFAAAATRDDASAARMQEKLGSKTVALDDLFPPADRLPEGIPAARLRDQYGGVGGPGYRLVELDLLARLEKCQLLH